MRKLNWTQATAAAHAIQAFQALNHIGATFEHDGRLRLREKTIHVRGPQDHHTTALVG
jgi:hypothetical protein